MQRWLVAALVAVLAVAGWLGWQAVAWRQAYFAEGLDNLVYHVDMAHRQLVRAASAADRLEQVEAMASAHGYLVAAQKESLPLLDRIAPSRKGRPAYMPSFHVPMLLQYARSLSPDMPAPALQRRIELVAGLERALKGERTPSGVRESLSAFFGPMEEALTLREVLRFEDEVPSPVAKARWEGSEVLLAVEWGHRYQLFPHDGPGYLVLVRPGSGVTVRSDAGPQQRMGRGTFPPFAVEAVSDALHEVVRGSLPEGWAPGAYTAIRIPDGLPQSLTLSGVTGVEALLVRPGRGEPALRVPFAER